MQNFSQKTHQMLNDAELLTLTLRAAKTEKEATLALLDYLVEIDARRLYATVNTCSSLFDYLVKELGFSHPAASERVNTVRLMRAVPLVKEHLETGKLTLTSAAQIQRFVNAEQKVDPKGRAVSTEVKQKIIDACLGKSKREVEKTLFEKQSEPARILTQEKVRALSSSRTEIKFTVDEATLEKLKQLKDMTGDASLEKIFDQALDALLMVEKKRRGVVPKQSGVIERKIRAPGETQPTRKNAPKMTTTNHATQDPPADKASARPTRDTITELTTEAATEAATEATTKPKPLLRPAPSSALNSRFIPIDLKRFVFSGSNGRCE